jgi:hypothetical protein
MHARREGLIDVLVAVASENDEAFILLHALQQLGHFDAGVAVIVVFDLGVLVEQRIGPIEE